MKNYIEGYVSFPLLFNCGYTSIVKVKKICDGYNVRVYIENDCYIRDDFEYDLDAFDSDSRCSDFTFQFNTQQLFIGVDNCCECDNDNNCEDRFADQCVGLMTEEQFEEYSRTDINYKYDHYIGTSILAHIHGNTYIVLSAISCGFERGDTLTNFSRKLNSEIFLFNSHSEIVGYCSSVRGNGSTYPYAIDANNYYYNLSDTFKTMIHSLDEENKVICDPVSVCVDHRRKHGISICGRYSISDYEINDIYDSTTAQVRDVWEFLSVDPVVTEIIGGLGPKSAAKTC